MFGLPKVTELHRQLPKKSIYEKFHMSTSEKEKIDADISRISVINEISSSKVHIAEGELIKTFFAVHVILKRKDFDEWTIVTISKLISQNMLFVLEYGDKVKLVVYHKKLMQTSWIEKDSLSIELRGLTLDSVWENIIVQISGIQIEDGNSLDEQIEIDDRRRKLRKEIDRLDKAARKENQPKKKFELVQKRNKLKKELKESHYENQ